MNKLFFTMCMMGGFAVIFGSCKKNDDSATVSVNLPAFEEEADGKAYIDVNNGNSFKWNANDQIVIYNLDNQNGNNSEKAIYQTTANAEGRASATFSYASGDVLSAKKYGYFVFYPVEKVSENKLNEINYETFTVSNTQQYTMVGNNTTIAPEGMAMACDLQSLSSSFTLQHIFGALRLKIKGTGTVNRIEVIDENLNLSGTVGMKLHEVTMAKFTSLQNAYLAGGNDPFNNPNFMSVWNELKEDLSYSSQGDGKMMTLDMGDGVALKGSNTETSFYIGLRPGALKYGYTLKLYLNGQSDPVIISKDVQSSPIKAGVIKAVTITL